jgi:two-component system sensor histidine kinase KdpD
MERPDPDILLARVQHEDRTTAGGRLKIFFGAAPGVGKTYAMLSEAREKHDAGLDVVVGVAETHGRAETEALLQGLEVLPRHEVNYRGVTLHEFDLDAALWRHPELLLIDELAHTNAPEARHAKRWQDVEEVLDAGIDVYTTVNVQHVESLNDVVAQITGVVVRETVPDSMLERADAIELVDLAPEELLQRLHEGKVYVPQQAEQAIENFFRTGNLIALRELALRRTADRVDEQMRSYRRDRAIAAVWPTHERVLVCIHANPLAARLVRTGRRLAAQLRAPWYVVYVETAAELRRPEPERDGVVQALQFAEQLGAEVVTLSGENVADEIVAFARARNISSIVVGKSTPAHWRTMLFGSTIDALVRTSGDIDVLVISGKRAPPASPAMSMPESDVSWNGYVVSLGIVVLLTMLGFLARNLYPTFAEANIIMAYLLAVLGLALRYGRGPSILASFLGVVAFDFFFVPPYLTLAVANTQYILTFIALLIVALIVSTLTVRLHQQADAARQRERRTAALYALSRDLANARDYPRLLRVSIQHVSETFDSKVLVLLPFGNRNRLQPWGSVAGWWSNELDLRMVFVPEQRDEGVAQWVYEHNQLAGAGTNTLPGAQALYMPLVGTQGVVGVLGVKPSQLRRFVAPDQLHLLETFANQLALALERARLAGEAEQAHIQIEAERLRNALLSTVSHDLRTPLASITGAASTLMDIENVLPATIRAELTQSIYDEAVRLNRLVTNLLDMTRLESGAVKVTKEWQPLEEVIGTALSRLDDQLRQHAVEVHLSPDLPLVPLDGVLIGQVLMNLLENAAKYSSPGSPITMSAEQRDHAIVVAVVDRGPGISPGDEQRIFDKFYRGTGANGTAGAGLGLTISKGIIAAHGGRIWAENCAGGGTRIQFILPIEGTPPDIEMEV